MSAELFDTVSHYYLLNRISHDATEDQIKRGYRVASRAVHPDRHTGDPVNLRIWTSKFQRLVRAKEELLDPIKRNIHDEWCATQIFTYGEADPGDFFRRKYEEERRQRAEAAERRRNEERRRWDERQERRTREEREQREAAEARERTRREAEERSRRESEDRARRERDERAQARNRTQQERERHDREQRERQQGGERRESQQQYAQFRAAYDRTAQPEDFETFLKYLYLILRLKAAFEASSENARTSPRSTPEPSSIPRHEEEQGVESEEEEEESPLPNEDSGYASDFSDSSSDTSDSETPEYEYARQAPPPRPRQSTPFPFADAPRYSSYKRWSASETEYLLRMRRHHPHESWPYIASRVNAQFGNGRSADSVRCKHRASS